MFMQWNTLSSKNSRKTKLMLCIISGFLLLSTLAAQAGESEPEIPRPCADELERFCKDVKPGLGLTVLCLDQYRAELSPVCRDKVGGALAKLETAKQDCSVDITKFCSGVKPGGGRLLECLKKQVEKLTPTCRSHVQHYITAPVMKPTTGK
jgi:hypothetical protein